MNQNIGMKCTPKTMLKIGLALAALLALGFFLLPQFRPAIISTVLFALIALCPLSMIVGAWMMNKNKKSEK